MNSPPGIPILLLLKDLNSLRADSILVVPKETNGFLGDPLLLVLIEINGFFCWASSLSISRANGLPGEPFLLHSRDIQKYLQLLFLMHSGEMHTSLIRDILVNILQMSFLQLLGIDRALSCLFHVHIIIVI